MSQLGQLADKGDQRLPLLGDLAVKPTAVAVLAVGVKGALTLLPALLAPDQQIYLIGGGVVTGRDAQRSQCLD
jgi:hypothetical protein